MTSTKFNNETITLEIKRQGYGQYLFIIETDKYIYSKRSTDSILFDAINSDEDETNEWGTRQDAIDSAIEMVLNAHLYNYTLSK